MSGKLGRGRTQRVCLNRTFSRVAMATGYQIKEAWRTRRAFGCLMVIRNKCFRYSLLSLKDKERQRGKGKAQGKGWMYKMYKNSRRSQRTVSL